MRWKQVFPLIGVVVFIAGLLAIFWFTRERDEEVIARIVLEDLRRKLNDEKLVEGRDYSVGEISIFQRKGEVAIVDAELSRGEQRTHLFRRVRAKDGGWVIDADLAEEFQKAATTQEFTNGMQKRLGTLLTDRWQIDVNVRSTGEQFVFALRREGDDVFASCHSWFEVFRTDRPQAIQYIEDFRYVDGAWVVAYQGRWLEKIR